MRHLIPGTLVKTKGRKPTPILYHISAGKEAVGYIVLNDGTTVFERDCEEVKWSREIVINAIKGESHRQHLERIAENRRAALKRGRLFKIKLRHQLLQEQRASRV